MVISGSGFSSNVNDGNVVFIGSKYGCDPIPLHSTVNQVICKTRPALDGFYSSYNVWQMYQTGVQNITVVVNGEVSTCRPVSSGATCSFEYRTDGFFTPRIDSLSPLAVSSGDMLTVTGFFLSNAFVLDEVPILAFYARKTRRSACMLLPHYCSHLPLTSAPHFQTQAPTLEVPLASIKARIPIEFS